MYLHGSFVPFDFPLLSRASFLLLLPRQTLSLSLPVFRPFVASYQKCSSVRRDWEISKHGRLICVVTLENLSLKKCPAREDLQFPAGRVFSTDIIKGEARGKEKGEERARRERSVPIGSTPFIPPQLFHLIAPSQMSNCLSRARARAARK
jgi:hypothetical protein